MYPIVMKKSLLLLLLVTFLACSKDDNTEVSGGFKSVHLVTGLRLTTEAGEIQYTLGNPNNKQYVGIDEELAGTIQDRVHSIVCPNPVIDVINISCLVGFKKIWLVKGIISGNYSSVDFDDVLKDHTYSEAELDNQCLKKHDGDGGSLCCNVSDLKSGYYRVFFQTEDDEIYWENIYVDSDYHSLNEFYEYYKNGWKELSVACL
ncbi:hypothetical protein DMA11_20500 [Marinilabiliaceae bacterium JC017]|nr:hypothetical protein DMA11_20500 [Marinilabiliaceae bacterium JC017]